MQNPSSVAKDAMTRPWGAEDSLLRRTIASGARLLRGEWPGSAEAAPEQRAAPHDRPPGTAPPPAAPVARHVWTDRLWGEGMRLPGGAEEVLRLAALLPLRPENTLLVAGLGARAAGGVVAGKRGCFVAAHDLLAEQDATRARGPNARRVTGADLSPEAPGFRRNYHDHALLLEPLRQGGAPASMLRHTAEALRAGGELVLFELVAREAFADAHWLRAEERGAPPPERAVPAALKAAGFHVHVMEDAGPRQQRAALEGWLGLLEGLRGRGDRPSPREAAALVREAEAWLLRLRLMREGRLRLLRWHATKRASLG